MFSGICLKSKVFFCCCVNSVTLTSVTTLYADE